MYEKRILEVYRYCNVRSFPIDCDDIIQKLGYRIVTYQSVANGDRDKLIELMQISNDAFIIRKERTMYINANADRRRQRFTKCHEIGHIVIPTNDEDEADTFASEILAPLPVIRMYGLRTADDISKRFDISISAANNTVRRLLKREFIYDFGMCDYFRGIESENIVLKPQKRYVGTLKRSRIIIDGRARFIKTKWNELRLARYESDVHFC